jgi:hypothetical protein
MANRLGHDVAEDMLDAGLAQVTMIQRSPTCTFHPYNNRQFNRYLIYTDVLPAEYLAEVLGCMYTNISFLL